MAISDNVPQLQESAAIAIGRGRIELSVDAGDADGQGGKAEVFGILDAALASLVGGPDADTFHIRPSAMTPFEVHGGGPDTSPGDVLNLDLERIRVRHAGGPGDDAFTFANARRVRYTGIEEVNAVNVPFRYEVRLRPTAGEDRYFVYTRWDSEESFQNWVNSAAFTHGHAKAESADGKPVSTGAHLLAFEVVQHVTASAG